MVAPDRESSLKSSLSTLYTVEFHFHYLHFATETDESCRPLLIQRHRESLLEETLQSKRCLTSCNEFYFFGALTLSLSVDQLVTMNLWLFVVVLVVGHCQLDWTWM